MIYWYRLKNKRFIACTMYMSASWITHIITITTISNKVTLRVRFPRINFKYLVTCSNFGAFLFLFTILSWCPHQRNRPIKRRETLLWLMCVTFITVYDRTKTLSGGTSCVRYIDCHWQIGFYMKNFYCTNNNLKSQKKKNKKKKTTYWAGARAS